MVQKTTWGHQTTPGEDLVACWVVPFSVSVLQVWVDEEEVEEVQQVQVQQVQVQQVVHDQEGLEASMMMLLPPLLSPFPPVSPQS